MAEIHERREECDRLTGVLELQKQHFKQELEYLGGQLREESIRCDRCCVHCEQLREQCEVLRYQKKMLENTGCNHFRLQKAFCSFFYNY